MLDAEVEKIKSYLQKQTGGPKFNIIPIRNDLSHVIKVHEALSNNELIALHGDRYTEGAQAIELDFMGRQARFPLGPFIIASKFKAPVTFVYAVKDRRFHYRLSATPPIFDNLKPEEIAGKYVRELEAKTKRYPEQWFNYFDFYEQ